jgi:NAD(P)-dependent dehydrogenase (short-subunit alcohol dehydrogenase family)
MMLKNKIAVVYGAGGGIGGAVARAFAREGARVFLTGPHRAKVEAVAKDIASAGGFAEASEVDALDEKVIDEHLEAVVGKAGRVDISFNAIGVHDTQALSGGPLVELDADQFFAPIKALGASYFLTARLAARRMVPNKAGVIMTVTTLQSRKGVRMVGGYGPAQAVIHFRSASRSGVRRACPSKSCSCSCSPTRSFVEKHAPPPRARPAHGSTPR